MKKTEKDKEKTTVKEKGKALGTGKLIRNNPARNQRAKSKEITPNEEAMVQGQSKQEKLINMLKHQDGATIEEMAKATGWQHHSIRGVISGVLRKRLGLPIISKKDAERGLIYRIRA